jgi:hypothetical protein
MRKPKDRVKAIQGFMNPCNRDLHEMRARLRPCVGQNVTFTDAALRCASP